MSPDVANSVSSSTEQQFQPVRRKALVRSGNSSPNLQQKKHDHNETKPKGSGGLASSILNRLLSKCGNPPLRIELPNGTFAGSPGQDPVGTIRIRDYRTALAISMDPNFQFGEAYSNGKIEVEGDLVQCLTVLFRIMNQRRGQSLGQRALNLFRRPAGNHLSVSPDNIQHHYDVGNSFYRLWLDSRMLYTCAYFPRANLSLEDAQVAKMDHVCRKLRLKPGMNVVEAGCGWGALALHMAKNYGVNVTAFNISKEQIAWARDQVPTGLKGRVSFVEDDWRNVSGRFDAFVSVGMLEHVGLRNYRRLGNTIHRCLKPDGIGLIHSIGQNSPLPMNSWIERRIFPGAQIPSISEMMNIFETPDFSVLDIENLRLHYAETLRHWLARFENSGEEIRNQYGDKFLRTWRLYLAGSAAAFQSGCMQLFQVVFANGTANNIPRTREYQYDHGFDCRIQEADCFPDQACNETIDHQGLPCKHTM